MSSIFQLVIVLYHLHATGQPHVLCVLTAQMLSRAEQAGSTGLQQVPDCEPHVLNPEDLSLSACCEAVHKLWPGPCSSMYPEEVFPRGYSGAPQYVCCPHGHVILHWTFG